MSHVLSRRSSHGCRVKMNLKTSLQTQKAPETFPNTLLGSWDLVSRLSHRPSGTSWGPQENWQVLASCERSYGLQKVGRCRMVYAGVPFFGLGLEDGHVPTFWPVL